MLYFVLNWAENKHRTTFIVCQQHKTFTTQHLQMEHFIADKALFLKPDFFLQGPLVYVNYGRIEDFQFLRDNRSMNLNGSIAFARYGRIFRGSKV